MSLGMLGLRFIFGYWCEYLVELLGFHTNMLATGVPLLHQMIPKVMYFNTAMIFQVVWKVWYMFMISSIFRIHVSSGLLNLNTGSLYLWEGMRKIQ